MGGNHTFLLKRWLLLAVFLAALTLPPAVHAATVYVVNHGWHTGLVIRRGDIPADLWPEHREAPPGEYLEVGWGQRTFYQTRGPSLLMALRAAFWPGPSVLHLVGFNGPAAAQFPGSEIVALQVDPAQMARLVAYIAQAYERDADGKVIRLGNGLYGDSRFFAAHETFHLLKTCNVWTARALRLAGCPVARGITSGNVLAHAAQCAT